MKDYFTLPQRGGKMDPDELEQWLAAFHSDDNRSHMVFPGMVYISSPTNQQFPILTRSEAEALEGKVRFEVWERLPDGRLVTRFATSWATSAEQVDYLESLLYTEPPKTTSA